MAYILSVYVQINIELQVRTPVPNKNEDERFFILIFSRFFFPNYHVNYFLYAKFLKRSSPSINTARGQAIFQRMKPSPSAPYILPALSHSLASLTNRCSSCSDEILNLRQSIHTR